VPDTGWENALEAIIAFLPDPPAPGTAEGRRFDATLQRVLASAPVVSEEALAESSSLGLDSSLRQRLDELARRRAGDKPFGEHPDGIGTTLGMDLSRS